MVMWSGTPDIEMENFYKETGQYSKFLPYPLCQPSFKTDIVRLKVDTIGISDWNEYDYIKLLGGFDQGPGLLSASSLYYEPPPNMQCIDSFSFKMSDCMGQLSRTSGATKRFLRPSGYEGDTQCEPLDGTAALSIGLLHPIFVDSGEGFAYDQEGHNQMIGSLMAIEEINNKLDGIEDDLLPNTIVRFEIYDSRKSDNYAIQGAVHHMSVGANAVVGPATSGASKSTQLVLANYGIPQISYSATSHALSDSGEYPTFFRTVASETYQAKALSQFLKNGEGAVPPLSALRPPPPFLPRERGERKNTLELPTDLLLLCERSRREERSSAPTTTSLCEQIGREARASAPTPSSLVQAERGEERASAPTTLFSCASGERASERERERESAHIRLLLRSLLSRPPSSLARARFARAVHE
jgi:hypothetical protein